MQTLSRPEPQTRATDNRTGELSRSVEQSQTRANTLGLRQVADLPDACRSSLSASSGCIEAVRGRLSAVSGRVGAL
eukprot:6618087-Pyramimonas_sp.AAC.1